MKIQNLVMSLIAVGMVAVATRAVYADPAGSATAHVFLQVNPNIAVQAIDANLNLGTLQTGDVSLPITFRIDANTEAVSIAGLVTDLYKGDDPTNKDVAPIVVDLSRGFPINPTNAHQLAGGSGIANYLDQLDFNGYNSHSTELLTFESSQNGHFSQDVFVSPSWLNTDNEKPQGEYSGFVVLFSSIVD